ncbi:hypothetical protein UFOVP212_28 [uncultured Caudovirales phage]|uniref:Uncharacterized protein n=1 Tax=uncultured Caudovirales phage TaxID=2100421 RepID=A0A6J7WSX3_9CAUD|nr:hypothetical protein UFOVP212_28 [uncultured Caudovirales phage]
MKIIQNLINSFKLNAEGFSARKLSAFIVIVMVITLHIKWFKSDRWEFVGEILTLDFSFISVCLGMTTYESIKKIDNTNK